MDLVYDLHSHTTSSDGVLSPEELVLRAKNQGVSVLGVTDHDTIDAIEKAQEIGEKVGVKVIPGVEISTNWNGSDIHILGLQVNTKAEGLTSGLASICEKRENRARLIAEKLDRFFETNDIYDTALSFSKGKILGRAHFARALITKGFAKDVGSAFNKYLLPGKPGYVTSAWPSVKEAVEWIVSAGGIALIAHPLRYSFRLKRLREFAIEFAGYGGEGLEVISGRNNNDENLKLAKLAQELGLYASVGSDYHGKDVSWCELGRLAPLPSGCSPVWTHERFAQ